MSQKRPTTVKPPPLKFCKKDEQTAYDVKHSAGDKKTSKKVKSNDRKETSSEIVVDIPTEVYFWGNDFCSAVEEKNDRLASSICTPRLCSFKLSIKMISCGTDHTGFLTCKYHLCLSVDQKLVWFIRWAPIIKDNLESTISLK